MFPFPAIWFAASEGHNHVLKYLLHKEHDTYSLMEDKRFVFNLMVVSKGHMNRPIEEFILVSPAPVDTAAKLSNIYINLSTKVSQASEVAKRNEAKPIQIPFHRKKREQKTWWQRVSSAKRWPRNY